MSQDYSGLASAINLSDISAHPAEAIAALLEVTRRLEQKMTALESRIDEDREYVLREIAMDRKRIAALERPAVPRKGGKTDARLRTLENMLVMRGNVPLTFSEVGKFLELGHRDGKTTTRRQNMTLLGKIAAEDGRFRVFESNTQKGAKMIALDDEYFSRGPPKV